MKKKSNRKIKLFLGGYLNVSNAQNINCAAIARHINKEKFEVAILELYKGNIKYDKIDYPGIRVIRCFYPHKISKIWGYFFGVFYSDICYLPKWSDIPMYLLIVINLLGKRVFTTIDCAFSQDYENIYSKLFIKKENIKSFLVKFNRVYCISQFIKNDKNTPKISCIQEDILPFGSEFLKTDLQRNAQEKVSKVVFVAHSMVRKGLNDYVEISKRFPGIEFLIIGPKQADIDVEKIVDSSFEKNIVWLNTLDRNGLFEILQKVHLHILPSRIEGFPKMILDAAACGVPSLVYSDYGAEEWLKNGENGFVVNSIEEMFAVINLLKNDSEVWHKISERSKEIAEKYNWNTVIKKWEIVIESVSKLKK